jgi:prolipoprotein diacylglyceryltransferase
VESNRNGWTFLSWLSSLQTNRLVLEEIEVKQNMNPSAIHIPTFIWSVLAVIVGLILYHMLFGRSA